jgi:hypothetical protein
MIIFLTKFNIYIAPAAASWQQLTHVIFKNSGSKLKVLRLPYRQHTVSFLQRTSVTTGWETIALHSEI